MIGLLLAIALTVGIGVFWAIFEIVFHYRLVVERAVGRLITHGTPQTRRVSVRSYIFYLIVNLMIRIPFVALLAIIWLWIA